MEESKIFSKAPGYYHWVLVISIHLFVHLFIFSVNKFILTGVNKTFLKFKSSKILLTCRSSPPEVFSRRKTVLWMCWEYSGTCLCVGVILIKLQSGLVEVALLHCCAPVSWIHFCRASFLSNTSGRLLLSKYNFIYGF